MPQLTITNTLRGTYDGEAKTISNTHTATVTNGAESAIYATNAWQDIASATSGTTGSWVPVYVVLINMGEEDAIYRITDGTNYYRMNLPAGSSVTLQLSYGMEFGIGANTNKTLAVYSANGTRIKIGVFI